MAFTQFTEDMDIISKLSDTPNVDDGLTAAQLKAEFDKAGKAIKDYINNVLLQEAVEKPNFTGLVKVNGRSFVVAVAGTDYQKPIGNGGVSNAMLANGSVTKAKLGSDVTPAALGAAPAPQYKTATLTTAGWSSKKQTVSVAGVTASNHVIVTHAPASFTQWVENGVRCSAQGSGTLTFQCEDVPTAAITVNIRIEG